MFLSFMNREKKKLEKEITWKINLKMIEMK